MVTPPELQVGLLIAPSSDFGPCKESSFEIAFHILQTARYLYQSDIGCGVKRLRLTVK